MNIYETITKILEETPAISKGKTNTTQGYKFRGIDDVMNTFNPLFAKYHLFIVPEVLEQVREERQTSKGGNLIYSICKIKYKFYAEDGTFVEATVIGEGMDSGDKATNKAMAIAMKYAMFQVFCIPTEEMKDPDAETPEESMPLDDKISKTMAIALKDFVENNGIEKDTLLAVMSEYGYKTYSDIKQKDYMAIKTQLESGRRN